MHRFQCNQPSSSKQDQMLQTNKSSGISQQHVHRQNKIKGISEAELKMTRNVSVFIELFGHDR